MVSVLNLEIIWTLKSGPFPSKLQFRVPKSEASAKKCADKLSACGWISHPLGRNRF
jgi:hypothetical protein